MTVWDELEVTLYTIYEEPISIEEKVLGIAEEKQKDLYSETGSL